MASPKIILHENQISKINPSLKYVLKSMQESIRLAICNNSEHLNYPNKLEVQFTFAQDLEIVKQDICCEYYFKQIRNNSQGLIRGSYQPRTEDNQ